MQFLTTTSEGYISLFFTLHLLEIRYSNSEKLHYNRC